MNRRLVMLLVCAALALAGCQTPKQYMKQHGPADLISDETREYYRMYRPGDDVDRWTNATTTLYYLDEHIQVRFKQGQVRKSAIPDDEIETLQATKTLLESMDAGSAVDW